MKMLEQAGIAGEGTARAVQSNSEESVPYCAVCGMDLRTHGAEIQRFGEAFCSQAHADDFAAAVTAERVQLALRNEAPARNGTVPEDPAGHCATMAAAGASPWKKWGMRALCWGGPLLALALVLGGGSILPSGASILSTLALLACPIGMGAMMWSMGRMRHGSQGQPQTPVQNQPQVPAPGQVDASPSGVQS